MPTDDEMLADAVARTLFIPLWARARETATPGGILNDRTAARIVSLLPARLFDFPKKKPMMIGSVVRSRHFDDLAGEALSGAGMPVLVHLGCGLDDRFGRTDKGRGCQVNIDLPEVMALRRALMPSRDERNIDWEGSLLETDWMDRLRDSWPRAAFSFFMEGLLMYFREDEVRGLFVNLAERFPGALLCFDACDSRMCKMIGRQKAIRQTNATFKWGMDDEYVLEQWHPGLKFKEVAYYFNLYRKRWGLLSLMRFVPRYAHGSKMLSYRVEQA